jgi:hypothetical protein
MKPVARDSRRKMVCLFMVLALCGPLAHVAYLATPPIPAAAVAVVANAEIKAQRLHLDAKTCLAIHRGDDPADALLRELRKAGLSFRKASKCQRNWPNGVELDLTRIELVAPDRMHVDVEIANMNIEPGSHFAILESSGTYTLVNTASGWSVDTYKARSRDNK